jgi:hypothetical protein
MNGENNNDLEMPDPLDPDDPLYGPTSPGPMSDKPVLSERAAIKARMQATFDQYMIKPKASAAARALGCGG